MDLPWDVRSYVNQDSDGNYTIVLNSRMSYSMNLQSYIHESSHIEDDDFRDCSVGGLERRKHLWTF